MADATARGTRWARPASADAGRPDHRFDAGQLRTDAGRGVRRSRFYLRPVLRFDVLLAGLLGALTLVVHDIGYMFSQPYWTDEGWVAISTRLPLHDLFRVSASTPIGFSLLLRLVVVGGPERLRLVPLLFSIATVIAAYVIGRSLPWRGLLLARISGALAAVAVLLSRSSLQRGDLKQYTADAFVALAVLSMVSMLERQWSRRLLVKLGVVVVAGFLFSSSAAFVGAAAFASLLGVAVLRRRWSRVVETTVVGGGSGVGLGVVFLLFYRQGTPPGLTDFWSAYYIPVAQGWSASWKFVGTGVKQWAAFVGMGPWPVLAVLFVAGLVTLGRLQRPASALFPAVLVIEMLVLGAARQYPLFDGRTSHFLSTVLAVTAAVGVAGICALVARFGRTAPVLAAVLAVAAMLVNPDVRSVIRHPNIPAEDVRTPALYIAAHLRPGDVVVVNMLSNWGFAYYWPGGTVDYRRVTTNLPQFLAEIPEQPNILMAADRTPTAIDQVMARAAALVAARGSGARVWLVHQHYVAPERDEYVAAIAAHGWRTTSVIRGNLDLLTPLA